MRKQKSQEANGHRLFAVALGVVTFAAIIVIAKQKYDPKPTGEMEHVVVTVHQGDTPWDLAREYCPDDVDIRDYLGWVEDANGITFDEPIYPGQRLIFFEEVDG